MIYQLAGRSLTGRVVGRSQARDAAGRRCYLFACRETGALYLVSGDLLREA